MRGWPHAAFGECTNTNQRPELIHHAFCQKKRALEEQRFQHDGLILCRAVGSWYEGGIAFKKGGVLGPRDGAVRRGAGQGHQSQPTALAQDVECNLKPKWEYLQHQLGGSSSTLACDPLFLKYSLADRYCPCPSHWLCSALEQVAMLRALLRASNAVDRVETAAPLLDLKCYEKWAHVGGEMTPHSI